MGVLRKVLVPDIGDFEEVAVIEILVASGDRVAPDQSLVTLESDKATMELPAPFAGVVRSLDVAVGDKVGEGSLLLTLEVEEEVAAQEEAAVGKEAAAPARAAEPAPAAGRAAAPSPEPAAARGRGAAAVPEPRPEPGEPIATLPAPPARGGSHASPAVRRLAHELGVDLSRVPASGRKERVLKEDVQRFVKQSLAALPAAPVAGGVAVPELPEIDFAKFGETEVQPLGRIRRVAARHLHRAWLGIPHVTQFDEADITDLEEFRRGKLEEAQERGAKLTLLVFLMKALEVTLKDFPQFNASLDRTAENLILKRYVHIGVAVDTENGLVVPVIRNVDRKGLITLASELAQVSQRARDRKLSPEDLSGGCITISSLGGIGGTAFTPIVNAPEIAVLGVSRSQIKPVYRGGDFVPRLMLPLSLSYDHRAIDGADAVRFTTRLKTVLSDIRNLIL